MDNPSSPLDTLRQLKEMLDAGALTPTEFEALKQRLVFNAGSAGTSPAAAPAPAPLTSTSAAVPAPPVATVPPAPYVEPPATTVPLASTLGSESASAASIPSVPVTPRAADFVEVPIVPAGTYEAPPPRAVSTQPSFVPEPVVETPPAPENEQDWTTNDLPETQNTPSRSPLALILSIGGLLALLALVMYLSFNRRPSEHLSSTSQTSADTLAAPIETGPQAEPLPSTMAAPETIRVVPARPAPRVQPQAVPVVRDSVAAPNTAPTDSAATP
ncbi:MAG: hypothetical protein JWR44_83 [Hymenobacter sp.]|jgi:hypothetical protein|nr:hypothetical protein [Hymenobacter sp.]